MGWLSPPHWFFWGSEGHLNAASSCSSLSPVPFVSRPQTAHFNRSPEWQKPFLLRPEVKKSLIFHFPFRLTPKLGLASDSGSKDHHFRWRNKPSRGTQGLFPREYSDFARLSQPLDDLGLVVGVVDSSLPELSRVTVLLPVVVPVSPAVGPEAKDVHLEERRRRGLYSLIYVYIYIYIPICTCKYCIYCIY